MLVENLRIIPPPSPIEPDAVEHQADEVETVERRALAIFNSEWETPSLCKSHLATKTRAIARNWNSVPNSGRGILSAALPDVQRTETTIAGVPVTI
jgi:hypothetical protein